MNGLTPKYLFDIIPVSNDSCYNTRVQSKVNLFNSIPEQKASVTLSFPSVLKNGTSWMIKSEIYHPFLIQKSFLIYLKTDENSIFMYVTP